MAVKLAASFGAEVTVLSRSPGKKADAQKLGAHDFVLTSADNALAPLANRYDAIVDTISAKHDINGPLGCLKRDGTLILVGASPQTLDLSPLPAHLWTPQGDGLAGGRHPRDPGNARPLRETRHHQRHRAMTTPDKINEAFARDGERRREVPLRHRLHEVLTLRGARWP
jgi:D-arabinose 1-dehydrogenase-like Zn-dependent alcohol dehydrogenase